MLVSILLSVRSQPLSVGSFGVVEERVEFVISHHCASRPRIYHRARDLQRAADLRSAVNEVANEDKLPGRMSVDSIALLVSQPSEQPLKLGGVAVNISNDIVFLVHFSPCGLRRPPL